jgi:hypothetical protein
MTDSITNERLLSVFEISVSGVIAPLLLLANEVLRDRSGTMFKVFNEVMIMVVIHNCNHPSPYPPNSFRSSRHPFSPPSRVA